MIKPHGGKLVSRIVSDKYRETLKEKIFNLKSIRLNKRQVSDLEMLAIGAYSSLKGFMCKKDYLSVLYNMRLANNLIWSIPITLAINNEEAKQLKTEEEIALSDEFGTVFGVIRLEEMYLYDKELEAEKVYKTKNIKHPGVNTLYSQGNTLLAGEIEIIELPKHTQYKKYYLPPKQTREIFTKHSWKTIVGFQTRILYIVHMNISRNVHQKQLMDYFYILLLVKLKKMIYLVK